ncbi:hypothetical protein TNCV_1067871 [Trichonephila clavipes]|nr:hypothetical protein TNCV_1067871 [Trichonephila clavipes]
MSGVGLGSFDLLPLGRLSGFCLGSYCKFSDTLSSPNREKSKVHTVTVSLFDCRDSLEKKGQCLTTHLRNSFPEIREMTGIFPRLSVPLLAIRGKRPASSQKETYFPLYRKL